MQTKHFFMIFIYMFLVYLLVNSFTCVSYGAFLDIVDDSIPLYSVLTDIDVDVSTSAGYEPELDRWRFLWESSEFEGYPRYDRWGNDLQAGGLFGFGSAWARICSLWTGWTTGEERFNYTDGIDWQEKHILDSAFRFVGVVTTFFTFTLSFLSFGILSISVVEIPIYLQWIPLLMVLPVWIYAIITLVPYVLKFIYTMAKWVDSIVPF